MRLPLTARYSTISPSARTSRSNAHKLGSSLSMSFLSPIQLSRRVARCKCESPLRRKATPSATGEALLRDNLSSDCLGSESVEPGHGEDFKPPCCDHCKYLGPRKQRAIIKEAMALSQDEKKRFLVSADWWHRWKDYVEYEGEEPVSSPQADPLTCEQGSSPPQNI